MLLQDCADMLVKITPIISESKQYLDSVRKVFFFHRCTFPSCHRDQVFRAELVGWEGKIKSSGKNCYNNGNLHLKIRHWEKRRMRSFINDVIILTAGDNFFYYYFISIAAVSYHWRNIFEWWIISLEYKMTA